MTATRSQRMSVGRQATREAPPGEAELSKEPKPSSAWKLPFAGACLAALVTLALTASPPRLATTPPVEVDSIDEPARLQFRRTQFFDEQVMPLVDQLDADNRAAAERCLCRIEETMDRYRDGVGPFARDLTSLSTRLGIIKRMPGGWWTEDGRVEAYVERKFAQHLFSEDELAEDVAAALIQFRGEVRVNQNLALTRIRAALTTADLPGVEVQQEEAWLRELSGELGDFAAGKGATSVETMLASFVMGEVGAFAARSVVAGLLTRFAPSAAIASAAGASATVGASATGAGGGSLGGPVGTVVGLGAGLAVGLVIDWWMTEQFESQLVSQMHGYLDDLETTLLDGSARRDAAVTDHRQAIGRRSELDHVGLRQALPSFCQQLRSAYRDRFFEQIVLGDTP